MSASRSTLPSSPTSSSTGCDGTYVPTEPSSLGHPSAAAAVQLLPPLPPLPPRLHRDHRPGPSTRLHEHFRSRYDQQPHSLVLLETSCPPSPVSWGTPPPSWSASLSPTSHTQRTSSP
ncbi:hypothetical protein LshimejAT787_1100190 [Lyophyllum shimeji]|uniref:Uncharacterized protein n=1 Tax=Lyophyllum shimeji TaxID=47721 RepID=A0A9P3PUY0_LYOSH|nr:hypothetical protein LshimejAT787_1100190 [Lyophyllum shimeji]